MYSEFEKRSIDYIPNGYNRELFADGKTFKDSLNEKRARYLYSRLARLESEPNQFVGDDSSADASKRRFLKS